MKKPGWLFLLISISSNAFAAWDTWTCVSPRGLVNAMFLTRFSSHQPIGNTLGLLNIGSKNWSPNGLSLNLVSSSDNVLTFKTQSASSDSYIVEVTFLASDFARMEVQGGDGGYMTDKVACFDQSVHIH